MKIKVIGKLNNMEEFEEKLNKYVNDGYKIISSNIAIDNKKDYIHLRAGKSYEYNSEPDIYFYALLQKD